VSDLRQLVRQAQQQGWTVEYRHGGHLCWRPPDDRCGLVFTASIPSDYRAIANIQSNLGWDNESFVEQPFDQ